MLRHSRWETKRLPACRKDVEVPQACPGTMGGATQKLSLESESQSAMRGTGRSETRPVTNQPQVLARRGTLTGPWEEMESKVQEDPPGKKINKWVQRRTGSQRGSRPKAEAICSLFYVCNQQEPHWSSKYCYQRSNPFPAPMGRTVREGPAAPSKVAGVGRQKTSSRKKGSEVSWLLNPLKLD